MVTKAEVIVAEHNALEISARLKHYAEETIALQGKYTEAYRLARQKREEYIRGLLDGLATDEALPQPHTLARLPHG